MVLARVGEGDQRPFPRGPMAASGQALASVCGREFRAKASGSALPFPLAGPHAKLAEEQPLGSGGVHRALDDVEENGGGAGVGVRR